MTMKQRHGARYQGIRVSFGYPACPDLEDQGPLFQLLKPEDIGVELTEGVYDGTGGFCISHGVQPPSGAVF